MDLTRAATEELCEALEGRPGVQVFQVDGTLRATFQGPCKLYQAGPWCAQSEGSGPGSIQPFPEGNPSVRGCTGQREGGKRAMDTDQIINTGSPIYEVILFYVAADELEILYQRTSGYVAEGVPVSAGFWHSREEALRVLEEKATELWDDYYSCAYLLRRDPGPAHFGADTERTFFLYSEEQRRYIESPEPYILAREWRS